MSLTLFRILPLSLSILLFFSSCSYIVGLFKTEKTVFDPCDPAYNYYEDGQHYIHDEMIKDDGTIDYSRILKGLDPENSRCDPLARPPAKP